MIPLTTDVRLRRGIPPTVTGIIVGTLLLHVAVQACIDFHWVEKDFRSKWMTFQFDNPNPFDWFLAVFSHGNYMHWLGNMLYLWIFGSILEDRLGSVKFFLLFLFCGFTATALHWGLVILLLGLVGEQASSHQMRVLGASGAISGVMGLTMFRFYKAKVILLFNYFGSAFWKRITIPIWIFCLYNLLNDFIGIFIGDNVAHLSHIGGFLGGLAAGRFLGLKKESQEEIHMELGQQYRDGGMFGPGAEEFEKVLKLKPDNALARQELGFCYWGLHNPAKSADTYLEKSRKEFEKALELYLKQEKFHEGAVLFERLMRLFSEKDFPEKIPLLLKAHQKRDGLSQAVLTSDPEERRKILEENFRGEYHRGAYQSAHGTLQELLSILEPANMDPSLLEFAGEVSLRVKDQTGIETFFELLAKKGDDRQTVRAMTFLSRAWLQTPKQLHLTHLYQKAEERLLDLKLFDEWTQLGEKLKN